MTKFTGIRIKVYHLYGCDHKSEVNHDEVYAEVYHVKLDANGFPYVVFLNEKVLIISAESPRETKWIHGLYAVRLEIVEGEKELKEILANPNLTIDKISFADMSHSG